MDPPGVLVRMVLWNKVHIFFNSYLPRTKIYVFWLQISGKFLRSFCQFERQAGKGSSLNCRSGRSGPVYAVLRFAMAPSGGSGNVAVRADEELFYQY